MRCTFHAAMVAMRMSMTMCMAVIVAMTICYMVVLLLHSISLGHIGKWSLQLHSRPLGAVIMLRLLAVVLIPVFRCRAGAAGRGPMSELCVETCAGATVGTQASWRCKPAAGMRYPWPCSAGAQGSALA